MNAIAQKIRRARFLALRTIILFLPVTAYNVLVKYGNRTPDRVRRVHARDLKVRLLRLHLLLFIMRLSEAIPDGKEEPTSK